MTHPTAAWAYCAAALVSGPVWESVEGGSRRVLRPGKSQGQLGQQPPGHSVQREADEEGRLEGQRAIVSGRRRLVSLIRDDPLSLPAI